jgi:hypothetical protein
MGSTFGNRPVAVKASAGSDPLFAWSGLSHGAPDARFRQTAFILVAF